MLVVHTPDELPFEHTERFKAFLAGFEARQVVLDVSHTESFDRSGLTSVLTGQEN